jgi:hypothetical protein
MFRTGGDGGQIPGFWGLSDGFSGLFPAKAQRREERNIFCEATGIIGGRDIDMSVAHEEKNPQHEVGGFRDMESKEKWWVEDTHDN